MLIGTAALTVAGPEPASGFPPYHLTDAETADPGALEARLGLARLARHGHDWSYASPLLRLNLGLPAELEGISEFEYDARDARVGDAAVGIKWAPVDGPIRFGNEALALLPVDGEGSAGGELSMLVTIGRSDLCLHMNVGAFHDGRPTPSETGWKGGVLGEAGIGSFRPGAEVFFRQDRSEPVQVTAGPGVVFDAGSFDMRVGVEVGLTDRAPDVAASFWVTTKVQVW